jgi:hypothetical protein
MEMVAWLAGEAHSDEPACACPVLGAVVRCWNDALASDAERERWLRPLVPLLVNTRAGAQREQARAFLAADCVARAIAPVVLRRQGHVADAHALARALPVRTRQDAVAVLPFLCAREVKAARWVVQRAAEAELAPQLWAAGLVWAARELGGVDGWQAVVGAIQAMLDDKKVADTFLSSRMMTAT